jgi:hypothetical protein
MAAESCALASNAFDHGVRVERSCGFGSRYACTPIG